MGRNRGLARPHEMSRVCAGPFEANGRGRVVQEQLRSRDAYLSNGSSSRVCNHRHTLQDPVSVQVRPDFKGELRMRPALSVAVLVLTLAPAGLGQTESAKTSHGTSVEQAIRKLDDERIQAQIRADAKALDRIYAPDFIGVGPSGTVRTKPQVLQDFTSGNLSFQSITTDDVQIRVYGNTAVETGRSTMNGQDKGRTVPRDTRFTRVWVKQQGRWRLVANHYSSLVVSP